MATKTGPSVARRQQRQLGPACGVVESRLLPLVVQQLLARQARVLDEGDDCAHVVEHGGLGGHAVRAARPGAAAQQTRCGRQQW